MLLMSVFERNVMVTHLMSPANIQHTPGQLRNRKSGGPGGAKVSEQGETIMFADVAGVDEAKEELEEIVVCNRFQESWIMFAQIILCSVLLLPWIPSFIFFNKEIKASLFNFLLFIAQEFLRSPDKYTRLGARPPRGVLLVS